MTPVEWLVEQVAGRGLDCGSGIRMKIQVPKDIAEQAKQMEKEQRGYTEEQAYEIWKAGNEYWRTSGSTITFEELTEKLKKK